MKISNEKYKRKIQTLKEYHEFVAEIIKEINLKSIVLLKGPMAAGKSEFVKVAVEKWHHQKKAASPTFALHHRYEGHPRIEHWDLYRIDKEEELENTGFWEQFSDSKSIVFIEWPEKVDLNFFPLDWTQISIEIFVDPISEEREISVCKIN